MAEEKKPEKSKPPRSIRCGRCGAHRNYLEPCPLCEVTEGQKR